MPDPQKEKELEKKLKDIQGKEAEEKAEELAKKAGRPYVDLTILPIQREALEAVEENEAKAANLAPIKRLGKRLKTAVSAPNNETTKNLIKK